MLKIIVGETRKSVAIKNNGETKYHRVGRRVVPYKGISFINVLCVLRKTLQIDVNFKYVVSEINKHICTGYYVEIEGEIFQHKTLGPLKAQEESAIRALETFVNRLICSGQIEVPGVRSDAGYFSKKTPHGELVETA